MKNLAEYEVLVNETFYKCWHILDYIIEHPEMSDLDKQAIKATIMDALVERKQIDPERQSLDLDNFCIVDNLEHYTYEKHPNICGIPLWMKDAFRKKCIQITGGIPISMFLAKAPSKIVRYCVYDPNTAVSAIFDDATFYNAFYDSPTRGIRITEVRPFVEIKIDGELYLVDTLTKRILKSSWFKPTYNFEVKNKQTVSKMNKKRLNYYKEAVSEQKHLAEILPFMLHILEYNVQNQAEMQHEILESKKTFPEEWERSEQILKEMNNLGINGLFLRKKDKK